MTKWLRFRDLQARNVVKSWTQLRRLIQEYGFPPGRMLSPNVRAWGDDEVAAWEDSRPIAGPAPRGAAKQRRDDRRRKAAAKTGERAQTFRFVNR